MPIYDFQCIHCYHTTESVEPISREFIECPKCHHRADKIFSPMGAGTFNEDAAWIRSVLEVVDKESKAPHVVEFLKRPTRQNYRNWMKAERLRHREPGEKGCSLTEKQQRERKERIDREVMSKHMARKKLFIGGL